VVKKIVKTSIREFSSRAFSHEEIEQIKWMRSTYSQLPIRELACTICEAIEWFTPSGMPKRKQCEDFLRQLADEGEITLPKSQRRGIMTAESRNKRAEERAENLPAPPEVITKVGSIGLEVAQAGARLQLLRAYMKKYHILGDKEVFGEKLYYFITDESNVDLGCMIFSAASRVLEDRERWIGWNNSQRKEHLFLIVNQSRYLIFPWVQVPNLSSRALSLAAKTLPRDWIKRYYYEPVLIETFVDTTFYRGTSYKAANWKLIGQTKGRGHRDQYHKNALSIKDIYMYPLRRDFKSILTGKKPYKAVNPDVF
jgi:hypothetical protein